MFWAVVIPSAGRSIVHRIGLSAVEILGNVFLGNFVAPGSSAVILAGNETCLQ